MRHFQLSGLKQLVGPLQADRNCERTEEMARNKQPMSNPLQNHSRWGAAATEERLRTLTFKAGTVRCFALQPVFKQHPNSFLIEHENPSREHADPAYQLSFCSLGMYFSSSHVCNRKPHRSKTKTPFMKYVVVNLWHINRTCSQQTSAVASRIVLFVSLYILTV